MNVLLFIDSDIDDIYSLSVLASQHFLGKIKIIGIVCDDGFLSYPQNISIVDYWFKNVLHLYGIDIYRGLDRDSYLKQQRFYPGEWISNFLENFKNKFGYDPTFIPEYKSTDELIKKINKLPNQSLSVLTTGNLTTFSYLLTLYPFLTSKFLKVYSMIGNYKVPGNVIPEVSSDPTIVSDSEYNAFIDRDSFSNVIQKTKINIVPLDCTNYAPLTSETIEDLITIGNPYYEKSKSKFLKNVYINFIKLLKMSIGGPDSKLYLWDLVTTVLFLNKNIQQKSIIRNVDINWTGKIIQNDKSINRCNIYSYIDYHKLIIEINKCIFE